MAKFPARVPGNSKAKTHPPFPTRGQASCRSSLRRGRRPKTRAQYQGPQPDRWPTTGDWIPALHSDHRPHSDEAIVTPPGEEGLSGEGPFGQEQTGSVRPHSRHSIPPAPAGLALTSPSSPGRIHGPKGPPHNDNDPEKQQAPRSSDPAVDRRNGGPEAVTPAGFEPALQE